MIAWMRRVEVILSSDLLKNKMVFGSNEHDTNLNISISGYKYLSALKDNFTVRISNLTYTEMIQIIKGEYLNVEIKVGYRSSGAHTIFKGSVLYISNELTDKKTHTAIILCTSKLIARYGQARMNMTLNSSINMYSALSFIMKRAGIPNSNIDEDFKNQIIREVTSVSSTPQSFLDAIANASGFVMNSDSSYGSDISIWSPYRKDARQIRLDSSNVILTRGYPTLTSDGLTITLLPTFNFMPGDTIVLDNSILDLSVGSKEEVMSSPTFFLDESGKYMIFEIAYELSNRSSSFSVQLKCRSRSLMSKIVGGRV